VKPPQCVDFIVLPYPTARRTAAQKNNLIIFTGGLTACASTNVKKEARLISPRVVEHGRIETPPARTAPFIISFSLSGVKPTWHLRHGQKTMYFARAVQFRIQQINRREVSLTTRVDIRSVSAGRTTASRWTFSLSLPPMRTLVTTCLSLDFDPENENATAAASNSRAAAKEAAARRGRDRGSHHPHEDEQGEDNASSLSSPLLPPPPPLPSSRSLRLELEPAASTASGGDYNNNIIIMSADPNHRERQRLRLESDDASFSSGADAASMPPTSASSRRPQSHLRSSLGAIANLCSATLGAGILSLPFAFYLTGWIVGSVMLVLSALATTFSIQILARASEIRHSQAYETLVEQHLSPRASALTRLCIVVFCFGCAVAYIIAIGDLFERLGLSRIPSMVVMWAIIMLPLSCQRKMKSLQCASSIGIASISMLVVCAGIQLLLDWNVPHVAPPDDGTPNVYNTHHRLKMGPAHGLLGILKACPIILFAFSCQVNVCAIYHELEVVRDREEHLLEEAGEEGGLARSGSLSLLLGGVAGDIIPGGIIEEDPASLHPMPPPPPPAAHDPSSSAVLLTEGSALIAPSSPASSSGNEPIIIAAASEVETDKSKAFDIVTYSAVGVCAVLYTSISLLALLEFDAMTPNLLAKYSVNEKVMQVAAAAVGLAVVLAFPLNVVPARTSLARSLVRPETVVTRRREPQPSPPYAHSPTATATSAAAGPLIGEDDDRTVLRSNAPTPRNYVQTPLLQENRVRVRSRHRPLGTFAHMALTLVVAGGALLVAIVVPDISVVFGLLGGTTTSWLGFCLPGWLGIKLLSKKWRLVSYLLFVGGVVIGVVTTAVTVATMF
jgi:amino acid permease